MTQLEQLDFENQQHLSQLVKIRDTLQEENNELKDSCSQLKHQNKAIASREKNLQKELHDLQSTLQNHVPSSDDKKNNHEFKVELEDTKKELSVIKSTHSTLEKTLKEAQANNEKELAKLVEKLTKYENENKLLYSQLQQAEEHVKLSKLKGQEDSENWQKLAFILESYEKQVTSLKEELNSVKEKSKLELTALENKNKAVEVELENTSSKPVLEQVNTLKGKLQQLNDDYKQLLLKNEKMHKTYINIITDNVKRYIDSGNGNSNGHSIPSDDLHITEFSKQVESIFKILLDFKEKCETMETQVFEASQEKTLLLNEKNTEIEKLMQNSEVLSQEIINKTGTIKELEAEISNLITSNDILMTEIESYKNSGLQTISESNEDNLVMLETALEDATEKIKELEKIVESDNRTESNGTLTENQLNSEKEDYQELLNSFDGLKIDYDYVSNELQETRNRLNKLDIENEDLKSRLEKTKTDFENVDYQLSEASFTVDSLKEEIEKMTLKLDAMTKDNAEMKMQSMNNIDLKGELNNLTEKFLTEENRRRELETEVKHLIEKLQASKMSETSFKLQCDTFSKETCNLTETKANLEYSLDKAKSSLAEYEKNYTELLQKYDSILLRCEQLNTNIHEKENECLCLNSTVTQLREENEELIQRMEQLQKKSEVDKSNDVAQLSAQLQTKENENFELKNKHKELELKAIEIENKLQEKDHEILRLNNILKEILHKSKEQEKQALINDIVVEMEQQVAGLAKALHDVEQQNENLNRTINEKNQLIEQQEKLSNHDKEQLTKLQEEIAVLQTNLRQTQDAVQELTSSRKELINMVTIKHQESITYHNEIQRLSQLLNNETEKCLQLETQLVQAGCVNEGIAKKNEEIDKLTDQNNFLKEKCELLTTNLLEEQSKLQQPSDKEISLSKQLERLQSHLMEVEEHYTQELLQIEQKNAELNSKVADLEQREKNSSNMYTSVSIRANQQVETLQKQLQMVTNQREDLRKKISDAEDVNSKQTVALANLQFVLEQFQKDREKDIIKETERIRRQINVEKQAQEELKQEISDLKTQLEESKQGLQAASRLSDQLELLKKQNSGLKEDVFQLLQKLTKNEQTIHDLTSQTDGKIEKSLIKNLIVGFLSSGNPNWNKDQAQVLKIIATVLDFNQQDHDKVKLNKSQHASWLGSILFPQPATQNMSQESLSRAFIKFLENESKPRVVPSLLGESSNRPSTSTESSRKGTPRASPIVLNEIVLPTFTDFGQIRNSSSILKDVLKDNS